MIRTCEGVSRCHPDKVCDQISDYILDRFLEQDPLSRVAIEVMGSHGLITVCGEVTTTGFVDINKAVNHVLKDVGYIKDKEHYGIVNNIVSQSPEIARGVDLGGAGDQGIMYGYATAETSQLLPLPYVKAMELLEPYQDRDAKSQVTMDGEEIKQIVLSVSGTSITPELPNLLFNPAGDWNLCGFDADTGLTGRKLGVDTYGGLAPHGGGAFSGKDPSKTDRSAAYMARYIAKQILKKKGAKTVQIALAYAIGVAEPVMATVTVDGIQLPNGMGLLLGWGYDLRPNAIIERLDLRKPIYYKTAQKGHFTDSSFPWER
jgi:S-adenosylmethionine synthetase